MSALPGNPYVDQLEGFNDPRNSLEMTATLAVAYEQRTANLIGMLADGANGPLPSMDYNALAAQIMERLGLSPVVSGE